MKLLTDALHWVFATEQKVKTMNDTVIDTVTGAQASVAEQPVEETKPAVQVETVTTVSSTVFANQLRTLLLAANGSLPTGFDALVNAALATVPTYTVTK